MTTIEEWLSLAEQHARLCAAAKMLKDTDQIASLDARKAVSAKARTLWLALLDAGYTVTELDARYNERVKGIVGREVTR